MERRLHLLRFFLSFASDRGNRTELDRHFTNSISAIAVSADGGEVYDWMLYWTYALLLKDPNVRRVASVNCPLVSHLCFHQFNDTFFSISSSRHPDRCVTFNYIFCTTTTSSESKWHLFQCSISSSSLCSSKDTCIFCARLLFFVFFVWHFLFSSALHMFQESIRRHALHQRLSYRRESSRALSYSSQQWWKNSCGRSANWTPYRLLWRLVSS